MLPQNAGVLLAIGGALLSALSSVAWLTWWLAQQFTKNREASSANFATVFNRLRNIELHLASKTGFMDRSQNE